MFGGNRVTGSFVINYIRFYAKNIQNFLILFFGISN